MKLILKKLERLLQTSMTLMLTACSLQIHALNQSPPLPTTSIIFSQQPSSSSVAGSAFMQQPKIQIRDASGALITSGPDAAALVTVDLYTGTGALGGTSTVAAIAGVADFSASALAVNLIGSGKILRATKADTSTSPGGSLAATATSSSFAITPAGFSLANSLVTISAGTLTSGANNTTTLTAFDTYGNAISSGGLTVTFALANDGSSQGTFAATIDHGDGSYTSIFTASTGGTLNSIIGKIGGSNVTTPRPQVIVSPSISLSSIKVASGFPALFTFSLNQTSALDVYYDYATVNGTALAGTDYTSASATAASVPAGQSSVTISVPTTSTSTLDLSKTLTLNVMNVTHAASTSASATATLLTPSLHLDFTTASLPSAITFTRASTATYFDASGILQTAAPDVPRFDYQPTTHALKGLLLEPQSTQLLTNSTGQSASSTTLPNAWNTNIQAGLTVSYTVSASATLTGYNDVKIRIQNSSGSNKYANFYMGSAAVTPGTKITTSAWFAQAGGSVSSTYFAIGTDYNNSGGTNISSTGTYNYPGGQRGSDQSIAPAGAASAIAHLALTNIPTATDFTIQITAPQMETGTVATSPIPTTTAVATRSADHAQLTTLSPWLTQGSGTVFTQSLLNQAAGTSVATNPTLWSFSDNSSVNQYGVSYTPSSSKYSFGVVNASSSIGTATAVLAITAGTADKVAVGFDSTTLSQSYNGAAVTVGTPGAVPTVSQLDLGQIADGTLSYNGYLQKFDYYRSALSPLSLKQLSQ